MRRRSGRGQPRSPGAGPIIGYPPGSGGGDPMCQTAVHYERRPRLGPTRSDTATGDRQTRGPDTIERRGPRAAPRSSWARLELASRGPRRVTRRLRHDNAPVRGTAPETERAEAGDGTAGLPMLVFHRPVGTIGAACRLAPVWVGRAEILRDSGNTKVQSICTIMCG